MRPGDSVVTIAVLTPSFPDRGEMLAEAIESVRMQTAKPNGPCIGRRLRGIGIGGMLNRPAAGVEAEWLARLDDETTCSSRTSWRFLLLALRRRMSSAPGATWRAARQTASPPRFPALGDDRRGAQAEDWDFWLHALDAGARVLCIPEVTRTLSIPRSKPLVQITQVSVSTSACTVSPLDWRQL